MAIEIFDIRLTREPLSMPAQRLTDSAGAVVEFWGVVRGLEGFEPIAGIEYEAHPDMAAHQLERIADEARVRFHCESILLHHRYGFVPAAVPSLCLRVSASRRAAAFDAAQWIVEQLKERVPIWKHPVPLHSGRGAATRELA